MAAAPTSFPRGKKAQQPPKAQPKAAAAATKSKKRKHSTADAESSPAAAEAEAPAGPDALFGKRGVAATGGSAAAKTEDKARKAASKKPRVSSATKDAALAASKPAEAPVLTFRGLKKGMRLLGVVRQVNDGYDLLVSLPNKLTGTVSLAECSDEFFQELEQTQQQQQKKTKARDKALDDQDEDEDNALPKLSAIFSVGQFVPVVVLGTAKENKHKQIHLSLRLSRVHAELSPATVAKGMALHASVASVEDHGAVVSLGIRGLHAFVPRKELPSGGVRRGQLLYVSVASVNAHTNTATVTPERSQTVKAVTRGDAFTLQQLVPGMLLNVRVEDVLANGLRVNFLTFFSATVEQNHMSLPCRQGWQDAFRKGLKGRARIVSIDAVGKHISLSMAPHVVHLQVPEPTLEVGDVVDKATIERIDAGIGMLLSMERKASGEEDEDMDGGEAKRSWKSFAPAYVHISNLADEHVDKIEKRFKVGEALRCRVIGFAPFDGLVMVSCKQSSLRQAALRHKDLTPGMKVSGKILAIDTWGILLELSEGVRGVVPAKHVPPFVALKKAAGKKGKGDSSGKFQVGRSIDVRVLRVDSDAKKTYLTMKKALVGSELPPLAAFEDAKMGLVTHGFITKIADYGVVVTFYNNVYGLVPAGVLRQAGVANLEEAYVLGQVVKACVTRCDVAKQRLTLSFSTSRGAAASTDPVTSPDEVPAIVGQTVKKLKIVDVEASCFRVQTPDGLDGVLPFVQLTDFPRQTALVDALVAKLSAGDVIPTPALAISQAKDGVVTFSMKPLLLSLASGGAKAQEAPVVPKLFRDVQAGAVLVGFVASVNANKGVFVKFLNNLVAVAPKAFLSDKFTSEIADGLFEMGETVVCRVEKLDASRQQFVVGFRHRESLASAATPAFFEAYASEASAVASLAPSSSPLAVGKAEKGEFLGLRPYGAVFSVERPGGDAATVVVPADQADSAWEEGARVKIVATDFDFDKRVYYGSVDAALVKAAGSKTRGKASKTRLAIGAKVEAATVVAVGASLKYVVASFTANDVPQLGVVQLCNLWSPSTTSTALGLGVGSSLSATVVSASLQSGAAFNPFQDLPLLAYASDDVLSAAKATRKSDGGVGADATSTAGLPKYAAGDLAAGQLLTGRIAGIKEASMEIRLKTSKKGGKVVTLVSIADVDEHVVGGSVRHPFDAFALHETVTGRVLSVVAKGANKLKPVSEDNPAVFHMLQLSLRSCDVEEKEDVEGEKEEKKDAAMPRSFVRPEWTEGSAGRALLQPGVALEGVVVEHLADSVMLKLSHRVTGYIASPELSTDVDMVDNFRAHFPVGKRVTAHVLRVDADKQQVDLSLVRASPLSAASLAPGRVVVGVLNTKVSAIKPPAVMVQLGAHVLGRVCVTELLPPAQWRSAMHELPEFATGGKAVRCVVLACAERGRDLLVDLSLREDALADPQAYVTAQASAGKASRPVGALVTGVVSSTTKGGCFVRLDRETTARVLLRELSDQFVKDPEAAFPAGTLVAGRVTASSARGLELSLKASVVSEDVAQVKWSDLAEGMTVKGTVTKVQPYGVFVKVDRSAISGLCHISEVADERVTQALDQVFAEGDYVKAKILKMEDRRVSFGLKPSYFEGEESSSEEEDDDEEDESEEEGDDPEQPTEQEDAEPMEVDDEGDVQVSSPRAKTPSASKVTTKPMEVDAYSSSDDDEEDEEERDASTAPVEFTWDGFANVLDDAPAAAAAASSGDESEDEDETPTAKAKARAKAKKPSDEWVALREKALASDADVPQSTGDYERLLAAAPHSSFLWIQYMAFHVSLTEVALARDVAARATSAVSFRDEKEKLNVWLAWLNLEHDFGDDESFQRVFSSALQVNHPKRVYLHLVDLYARAGELEDAAATLGTMQKKFRASKQTWLRALAFYVSSARQLGAAAETLQRALQSLAPHKHLPVILRYGALMYESGELDKARTIYEGVLANYPKRVDLWSVYVDKEVKFGVAAVASATDGAAAAAEGVARVRALLQRLLAMDFSAKKMKFWFKKALQFEQAHGDADGVARVQQLARDFVASAASKP